MLVGLIFNFEKSPYRFRIVARKSNSGSASIPRENWNDELINIERAALWPPNLVCRHPSGGRTLSRWQLPRVLRLIWQTTARGRSRGTRETVSLPRSRWIIAEESFSIPPSRISSVDGAVSTFPSLPPNHSANFSTELGRKGALRATQEVFKFRRTDSFKNCWRKLLEDVGSRGMQILREFFRNWEEETLFSFPFNKWKKLRSIVEKKTQQQEEC